MITVNRQIIDVPIEKIEGIDKMFGRQLKIDVEDIPRKFRKSFDRTRIDSFENFKIKALYGSFEIDEINDQAILLKNGMTLESKVLTKAFCHTSELVFCVIGLTGYEDLDEAEEDMLYKLFLDSWGTAFVEMGYVWLKKQLSDKLIAEGIHTTHSFSPGQGEVPMHIQRAIFDALNPGEIGFALNSRYMMHPKKSISGIIGIGTDEIKDGFRPCDICERRTTCNNAYAGQ